MGIQFLELQNIATKLGLTGYRTNLPMVRGSKSPSSPEKVILNVKEITKLDDKMIKSNEKEFIRNWHQHKVALTRENTRIKQPIRDEEITYDQSDISHLASGLPSGIDNLVRNRSVPPTQITHLAHFGRTGVYITPICPKWIKFAWASFAWVVK